MVQIGAYPELWTLKEQDSGRQLWETLDKLLWGAREEEPPVWIEKPAQSTSHGWYIIFNGRKWMGENLVELGRYEVRFHVRVDSDVHAPESKSPIKTRPQTKKKAAEKAAKPPGSAEPDIDITGLMKQVQAMSAAKPTTPGSPADA
jgi:hypothetical protein